MKSTCILFLYVLIFSTQSFADIEVAITVDDLPIHGQLPRHYTRTSLHQKMVEIFAKHNLPPIYGFINARKVERHPDLLEALTIWVQSGNPLGNHTYSHPHLKKTSLKEYLNDIDKNEPLLNELSRGFNWHYFRYPFLDEGNTEEKRKGVQKHLKANGYQIAHVSIDYDDWRFNAPYARCLNQGNTAGTEWVSSAYVEHAVDKLNLYSKLGERIANRPVRHILLMHIGPANVDALNAMIVRYKENGVKFISLERALEDPIYQTITNRTGGNLLDQMAANKHIKYPAHKDIPVRKLNAICAKQSI